MYRSVTESRPPRGERHRAIHRLEGALVGAFVFLGIFYALGWLSF